MPSRDRRTAADRVPDAEFVFEERQDREQARAVERRHAEVLRLERERQPDARVGEVAGQFAVERLPRPQERQQLDEVPAQQVAPAEERTFQAWAEGFSSFTRFSARKRRTFGASAGLSFAISASSSRHVRGAIEVPAAAEGDAVLRVEPHHRHFARAGRGRRARRCVRARADRGRRSGRGRSGSRRPRWPSTDRRRAASARRRGPAIPPGPAGAPRRARRGRRRRSTPCSARPGRSCGGKGGCVGGGQVHHVRSRRSLRSMRLSGHSLTDYRWH